MLFTLLVSVFAVMSGVLFPFSLSTILKHTLLFIHSKSGLYLLINLGQSLIVLFALISTRIHCDVSVHTLTALIFQNLDVKANYFTSRGKARQDLNLLI